VHGGRGSGDAAAREVLRRVGDARNKGAVQGRAWKRKLVEMVEGIVWETDHAAALKRARDERRDLLVDFCKRP
jgi:hypothetical protein